MPKRAYRGIDHVVIRTADAASLHELFSGPLGLPVTWPLVRATFATFGWIGLGNTNLEIWAATDNSDLPDDCSFPLIQQIALEPFELSSTLARVEALGFSCKAPRAYSSTDEHGKVRTNFTNSVLLDLSGNSCCVFFCEWGREAPIAPWQKGLTTPERRTLERDAMAACRGGPLGMIGLSEIELSTRDFEGATDKWLRLTESKGPSIPIAEDVELHLSAGRQDIIQSLTFAVHDLADAQRFLASHDLLDKDEVDEVLLSRKFCQGLRFRFVEAAAHPNA